MKKLDTRAEKEERKTPTSARTALKKRVDSSPSVSVPPKDAPQWAVAGSPFISSTPSASTTSGENLNTPEIQSTPEAPPGITAIPRRLAGEAFQELYEGDSSPSSSELDSDH